MKIFLTVAILLGFAYSHLASAESLTAPTSHTSPVMSVVETEAKVRSYFADIPVMIEIAKCESNFRQYTENGDAFYDASKGMVGAFQFYELIHKEAAAKLGFDLATLDGNLAYARYVYERQGTVPWRSCVPTVMSSENSNQSQDKIVQQKIKLMQQIIVLLQQLLALKLAEE